MSRDNLTVQEAYAEARKQARKARKMSRKPPAPRDGTMRLVTLRALEGSPLLELALACETLRCRSVYRRKRRARYRRGREKVRPRHRGRR